MEGIGAILLLVWVIITWPIRIAFSDPNALTVGMAVGYSLLAAGSLFVFYMTHRFAFIAVLLGIVAAGVTALVQQS